MAAPLQHQELGQVGDRGLQKICVSEARASPDFHRGCVAARTGRVHKIEQHRRGASTTQSLRLCGQLAPGSLPSFSGPMAVWVRARGQLFSWLPACRDARASSGADGFGVTRPTHRTGGTVTKCGREIMEILEAYGLTSTAWSASYLAGCDAKTVAQYAAIRDAVGLPGILRSDQQQRCAERPPRSRRTGWPQSVSTCTHCPPICMRWAMSGWPTMTRSGSGPYFTKPGHAGRRVWCRDAVLACDRQRDRPDRRSLGPRNGPHLLFGGSNLPL